MMDNQGIVGFKAIGLRGDCCAKIPDGVQAGVEGALDIGLGIVACVPDVLRGEVGLFECKAEDAWVWLAEHVFAGGYDEFEVVVRTPATLLRPSGRSSTAPPGSTASASAKRNVKNAGQLQAARH